MILQKIIFPTEEICLEKELYYRGKINKEENGYNIEDGENVKFNTYFNSFSIEKWLKYTNLDNLSLNLVVSGSGEINIVNSFIEKGKIVSNKIQTIEVKEEKIQNIKIEIENINLLGNISFEINASQKLKIYDGYYSTESKEENDINLGICICTFKREKFVQKNMNIIRKNILDNSKSALNNKIDIFIVDNAQTLDEKLFSHSNIHYIKNKNLGGAGGFTRGIIEAVFNTKNITHCILMDDDITLDTNVLEKTYAFLTILKKEYANYMLGGAMLLEDQKYIQAVSGEEWTPKKTILRKANADLRNEINVLKNEIEEPVNYNGWWYCCIPVSIIKKDNLPLPIFIHMDDVEYGVRNKNGVILLNGICVWHPSFINKGPITNTYYNTRNKLIIDAKYGHTSKIYSKLYLLVLIIYYMAQYKYSEAKLVLKGYNDFYSGIDNFKKIDGEKLHLELLKYKYQTSKSDLKIEKLMKNNSIIGKIFVCLRGIISYIMPQFRKQKIFTSNINVVSTCFAKKITILNIENNMEYSLNRDYKKVKECLKEYKRICKIINKSNKEINEEWKDRYSEITNIEFWDNYLGLKGGKK